MSPWLYLAIALVAGGIPSRWLWDGRMLFVNGTQLRMRLLMTNPGDNRRRRRWWKSKALWLDPVRGGVAGWCLSVGQWKLLETLEEPAAKVGYYAFLLLPLAMVLWQTVGREKEKECITPVLFLIGLIGGFYHWVGGSYGWVLGLSTLAFGTLTLMAMQSIEVMLFGMAATLLCIGFFLVGMGVEWLHLAALCLVPFARSMIFKEKLVLAFRG